MKKWFRITVVVNTCFVLPEINKLFDSDYALVFAVILIGSSIFFTDIIYKLKTKFIRGNNLNYPDRDNDSI